MRHIVGVLALTALWSGAANAAAVLKAQYLFNGTLNSTIGGPALTEVDPTNLSGFGTDTVFGTSRSVFQVRGGSSFAQQGGLKFDGSGLLGATSYSVAMTIKFFDRNGLWRRILDVKDRQSDSGFYVNTANNLSVFPDQGTGAAPFTNGEYRNVVLTVGPAGPNNVRAYIDGGASLATTTNVMNLSASGLIGMFLDDGGEWSAANIAALSFYDGVLDADQVSAINARPLASAVPEPASWAMMATGFGLAGAAARRRRKVRSALV